jgi:hypothetical protein
MGSMTDKPIISVRVVGGDCFYIKFLRKSNKKLSDFLHLFNFDDYWCYKCTKKFNKIDYESFLRFDYAGYIFFRKDLYKKEHIKRWIEFCNDYSRIFYLVKPTPPFNPEKIIIKK